MDPGFAVHGSEDCGDAGYFLGVLCCDSCEFAYANVWVCCCKSLGVESEVFLVGLTHGSNDFFPVSGLFVPVM
jgi:hypothetical protein